jgi:aryl-alcohol dehydrogenase-like predicted oxidoreductase
MKFTYLGRTGMKVSRLCLGTMNFGTYTDEKDAFRIMDKALDLGINFFDTANVYGGDNKGRTEEIIGRWFAQGGGRREKVILATKVYGTMRDEKDGPNDEPGLSAYKIRRHLEGSLRRLQTDHVELYQMHHVDRGTPWEEIWGAFEAVVNQGKVYYIGSSNFAGWHLAKAQAEAAKRNFLGLVSEQHKYNLLCRLPELEVLPASQELGLGVIPWSPLAGGLLGGNALNPSSGSRSAQGRNAQAAEEIRPQLEAFRDLAKEMGEKEADIALAWLLANPAVTAPIIGPRTEQQLEESLGALEIDMSPEVMQKLDQIFPGPGKPAPEAYAW